MGNDELSVSLSDFNNFAQKAYNPRDVDSFWNCSEEFSRLVKNFDPAPILNDLVQRVHSDPKFELPTMDHRKLVLSFNQNYTVAMEEQALTVDYIYSHPFVGMIGIIGNEPLHYSVYQLPEGWKNELMDEQASLIFLEQKIAMPGDVIILDGRSHVFDFKVEKPTFVLKFFSNFIYSLEWAFYRQTLKPWQVTASDAVSSRQDYMIKVLREIGNEDSISVLENLTISPYHYIRWSAIQAVASLDTQAGIRLLKNAICDPHPHIRASAEQAIGKFNIT